MPPKTRGTKVSKATKENHCVLQSRKAKDGGQNVKPTRKALADKTNSASDDNTSILAENLPKKSTSTESKNQNELNDLRPRRVKKLPNRYIENILLNDAPISKDSRNYKSNDNLNSGPKYKSPETKKQPILVTTPLKTNVLDNSLVNNRPKRICRLPSKFDDHSISPNKFIPVKPINASTPLANKAKIISKESINKVQTKTTKTKSALQKATQSETASKQKTIKNYFNNKSAADTNNNAKQKEHENKFSYKKCDLKILDKGNSEDIKNNKKPIKRGSSKIDVYEFTYDPNEEPPPVKKKRKKTVKKPTKPKIESVKSNYDRNLAKALAALKNTVSMKQSKPEEIQKNKSNINSELLKQNDDPTVTSSNKPDSNMNESIANEKKYNSVRIEDIALAMQPDDDNINYSPVNSPNYPKSPVNSNLEKPTDPLNLQDISFFDENPAASSSMNTSIRQPVASPWRVDFESLPIKWQVNTYVKPNLTPAFECSFINFNDSKKKHVYTNMVPEANESLPQVLETPNLKQTSIISFIQEVVEKSEKKKKKSKGTPVKAHSLFEDTNVSLLEQSVNNTSEKSNENIAPTHEVPVENISNTTYLSTHNENVDDKNQNDKSEENNTYFGFDESDQENISPKKKNKARSLRARTRGILQELNEQKGPMRAMIPVTAKSKPTQNAVNELFDGMKSATEPPVFPEAAANGSTKVTITEPTLPENGENDDSQSVHLFEDIDVVHHLKPTRKSYGKPKRVAFHKNSLDSDTSPMSDLDHASSDEDLDDLSFKLPSVKQKRIIKKKKTNKQKLSKKEKEVEAWAAGFNSMCEEIEEFDLVVE
ncbi:unnamed protein product, partial [Brenthis ino]